MAIISVYLDRVTNLADSDLIGKSDPYVRLELVQDVSVVNREQASAIFPPLVSNFGSLVPCFNLSIRISFSTRSLELKTLPKRRTISTPSMAKPSPLKFPPPWASTTWY